MSILTPHGEGQPYKIDTGPIPLDVFAEGPWGQTWYRIPSWRVYFDRDALKGVDMRLHRSVESSAVWTLTEATTGFKVFGDLAHDYYIGDEGAMLAEFCASLMLKMTPEKIATALAKARAELAKRPPNPFSCVSETSSIDATCLEIQRTVSDYTRRTPPHLRDCDVLTGHIVHALRNAAPQVGIDDESLDAAIKAHNDRPPCSEDSHE